MKNQFNPRNWTVNEQFNLASISIEDVHEKVTNLISSGIDITSSYHEWRNIGFAISDSFGESGRSIFHELSSIHSGYNMKQCDDQYDKCLKGKGSGITIRSFYHAYHKHFPGHVSNTIDPKEVKETPTMGNSVYSNLPSFLSKVIQHGKTDEDKDVLLLGSIVTLSSCLQNIYGIYGGKKVHPNLFFFLNAPASSGKGILTHCKRLVQPIHQQRREVGQSLNLAYQDALIEYNQKKKGDPPVKPGVKLLFIPANTSSSGILQLLNENDESGLIFETEGDTLTQTFKSDFGNYSDSFRKFFHHEMISLYRKTDKENIELEKPCVSAVISGTPKQVSSLIPNVENGLFSRFIFYCMNLNVSWKDVFEHDDIDIDSSFDELGKEFYSLFENLKYQAIKFNFTGHQKEQFNKFFESNQIEFINELSEENVGSIRRLGLIAFRIAMILSTLRILEHGHIDNEMTCPNKDFETTLKVIEVLIEHAKHTIALYPETMLTSNPKKNDFVKSLPKKFNRKQYLDVALDLKIKDKTAQKYIKDLLNQNILSKKGHDQYEKE